MTSAIKRFFCENLCSCFSPAATRKEGPCNYLPSEMLHRILLLLKVSSLKASILVNSEWQNQTIDAAKHEFTFEISALIDFLNRHIQVKGFDAEASRSLKNPSNFNNLTNLFQIRSKKLQILKALATLLGVVDDKQWNALYAKKESPPYFKKLEKQRTAFNDLATKHQKLLINPLSVNFESSLQHLIEECLELGFIEFAFEVAKSIKVDRSSCLQKIIVHCFLIKSYSTIEKLLVLSWMNHMDKLTLYQCVKENYIKHKMYDQAWMTGVRYCLELFFAGNSAAQDLCQRAHEYANGIKDEKLKIKAIQEISDAVAKLSDMPSTQ